MRVSNLINAKGNAIANQFVIIDKKDDGNPYLITFQSYDSTVCMILIEEDTAVIKFGKNWNFSKTTVRNLLIFLSKYPVTRGLTSSKDIQKAIENGYTLFNEEKIPVIYNEYMN